MKRILYMLALAVIGWPDAKAETNLIVNGGFESPANLSKDQYFPGETIDGWLVGGSGRLFLWPGGPDAYDGNQYLMLPVPGRTFSQVVNLQPGHQYSFEFHIFNYHDQLPLPVSQVDVTSAYPVDTLANSRTLFSPSFQATLIPPYPGWHFSWKTFSGIFTAEASEEQLSIGLSGWNAFFDGISLVEIPEPSGAMLFIMAQMTLVLCSRRRHAEGA